MNVGRKITALGKMTVAELRQEYAETFGESTRSRHKDFLIRRILWGLQAKEEGGLSERARQRAQELAAGADVRLTAPKPKLSDASGDSPRTVLPLPQDERLPMPGAILRRQYKGETVEVKVLSQGFEYEGEVFRTLSAAVKQITGTHWNGYHFFKLGKKGNAHGQSES